MQLTWSHPLPARPRGLSLAREKGWVLTWDETDWLYLLNREGQRQAQRQLGAALAAACCADDGSACVAVGAAGAVWWLAPDLTTRWQGTLPSAALTAALDPFGQYVAVADDRGGLHIFNRHGDTVCRAASARPLHHLAFAAAAPYLLASADFGFVGAYDLAGNGLWRDAPVAHVGALALSGDGRQALLACFSEGLLRYDDQGRKLDRLAVSESCRLVSVSFEGREILVGSLKSRLLLLDRQGRALATQDLEKPAIALALGPLGNEAVVARGDGFIVNYQTA
jgi:hypothetical protein